MLYGLSFTFFNFGPGYGTESGEEGREDEKGGKASIVSTLFVGWLPGCLAD
jgi:hypothetical protein